MDLPKRATGAPVGEWNCADLSEQVASAIPDAPCQIHGKHVFPEEVEEALKRHARVKDAACVGVPDTRFGEAVCGVVETSGPVSTEDLREFVKRQLAGYKAPRHIVSLPTLGRAPNGKVDYPALKARAIASLGLVT